MAQSYRSVNSGSAPGWIALALWWSGGDTLWLWLREAY